MWIIHESWMGDTATLGVFSSFENAEKFLKILQEAHTGYYIREYEVDKVMRMIE